MLLQSSTGCVHNGLFNFLRLFALVVPRTTASTELQSSPRLGLHARLGDKTTVHIIKAE